jgi:hypothetical protein
LKIFFGAVNIRARERENKRGMRFMKKGDIRAMGRLLMIFVIFAAAAGCGLWGKREPEKTPQGMFNEAQRLLAKKKYTQAAEAFKDGGRALFRQ